ncbi:hypothetical protein ACHQM5_009100 [Ranunculus cassubicifolius]
MRSSHCPNPDQTVREELTCVAWVRQMVILHGEAVDAYFSWRERLEAELALKRAMCRCTHNIVMDDGNPPIATPREERILSGLMI